MGSSQGISRRDFLGRVVVTGIAGSLAVRSVAAAAPLDIPYFQDRGWLVGFWTRPWAQHDYRVGFDAMAQLGCKYVALSGAKSPTGRVIAVKTSIEEAAQVGREARQRGLAITNVYGGGTPLEKGPESLRKMIENCAAAGAWSVLLSNAGSEKTYEACCRTIAACADYAAEKKIAIVLKPHGGTTGTGPQLRDAFHRVNHKAFTIMYDSGNVLYYSDGKVDPVADCQALKGIVTGLSVKDYRHPKDVGLTPGDGQIDFSALMKNLRAAGFTHGPLMIETLKSGDLGQTLAEAKKAKAFVERLVAV